MANLWKRERGQSLVEFALVLVFILLPVTIGIVDGSILFYKYVVVANTAREGARAGAIYQSSIVSGSDTCSKVADVDAERESVIITDTMPALAAPLVTIDDWDLSYDPDPPCLNPPQCDLCDPYRSGNELTVTITHTHTTIVGFVIGLQEINLTASATMRIEPGGLAPTPAPP